MATSASPPPPDGARLALAPLDEQVGALRAIVRGDPDLSALLALIRGEGLPDAWLVSGAIYQTVWNLLTGGPRRTGIRDYDVIYFDGADLGFEAEDATIRRVSSAAAPLGLPLEIRNQARVHLWFRSRFGFAAPPLVNSAESLTRYASTTHAVACRLSAEGDVEILAPYGLRDIFAMHVRANRLLPNQRTHDEKAERCRAVWPELTIERW